MSTATRSKPAKAAEPRHPLGQNGWVEIRVLSMMGLGSAERLTELARRRSKTMTSRQHPTRRVSASSTSITTGILSGSPNQTWNRSWAILRSGHMNTSPNSAPHRGRRGGSWVRLWCRARGRSATPQTPRRAGPRRAGKRGSGPASSRGAGAPAPTRAANSAGVRRRLDHGRNGIAQTDGGHGDNAKVDR